MTHLGKRSRRRRHLHLVGEDGISACCRAHRELAKRDPQLLCVTNADGVTQRYSTCPTCRTVLVIDGHGRYGEPLTYEHLLELEDNCTVGAGAGFGKYTREMSQGLAAKRPEMPEERMAGEVLPRIDTVQKRPWWQTQGALAVAVLLMFVAAAVIGKACKWLGH